MRCRPGGSIDMLPDDVLLEIFDFLVEEEVVRPFRVNIEAYIEEWQTLVHVCRRWRSLVFESPRRLNLRLFCSNRTPARDTLDVWPALPLVIKCIGRAEIVDNVIAVLECSDRVCHICLTIFERSYVGELSAAMQAPFPELIVLVLHGTVSALPDSFLGGSAPRLEHLTLRGIPFPGLPKLLLSATNLLRIFLDDIPHSGYFSPEAIVTALSTLTCLDTLRLHFESPQSRPDPERQHPPPPTRSVLPNLGYFLFKGDSEYLEVVVAHIDAPRLDELNLILFNDIVFDTPQLAQFISRTLTVKALEEAHVFFDRKAVTVNFLYDKRLFVEISCSKLDWQVSSMEQVCNSCLPSLPTLDLRIDGNPRFRQHWQGNVDNVLWVRLLHPFTSVKNLFLSEEIARRIVPALQELVGVRATGVLPTLESIFLEEGQQSGPVQEGIQQVVAMRQATNHSIEVFYSHRPKF